MKSKYSNVKTNSYDSKKEAAYAAKLKLLLQAGEIIELREQVKYDLLPTQKLHTPVLKNGRKIVSEPKRTYTADFVVTWKDGRTEVIDVKGMKTDIYKLKKALMLWVHNIQIKEV